MTPAEGRDGRIHLYPLENVLCPRGPMQKESLSLEILEKLDSALESWTSEEYADSVDPSVAFERILANMHAEVRRAEAIFRFSLTRRWNVGSVGPE